MLASEWAQKVIFLGPIRDKHLIELFLENFCHRYSGPDRPPLGLHGCHQQGNQTKAKDRFNVTVLVESNHNNYIFSLHMRAMYVFYKPHQ